jgi:hypothetical protein
MFRSFLAAVAACSALAACASPYTIKTVFNPADVAWSQQPGTATIYGQAFLRTRGGDVRTCAGNKVILFPKSAYTTEIYHVYQQEITHEVHYSKVINRDPEALVYKRETRCDVSGSFHFDNLPVGDWYVAARVVWEARSSGYGLSPQGGTIFTPAHTNANEKTEVILTR